MADALVFAELNMVQSQRNLPGAGLERQAQPRRVAEIRVAAKLQPKSNQL
jgi:hypothetical protein